MSARKEFEAVLSLLHNECEPHQGPVHLMAALGEIGWLGSWCLYLKHSGSGGFFASQRNICCICDSAYFIGTEQEDVDLRCENIVSRETLSMA